MLEHPHETIHITPNALSYLLELLKNHPGEMSLHIEAVNPGLVNAEVKLNFVEYQSVSDASTYKLLKIDHKLDVSYAIRNEPYLINMTIDLESSSLGKNLTLKIPNLYANKELSQLEKIQIYFNHEILPYLKQHAGHANLVSLNENGQLVLEFKGGCQGCSQAKVTLKHGIEKKLKERFPMITSIIDVTEHEKGTNPYCKEESIC